MLLASLPVLGFFSLNRGAAAADATALTLTPQDKADIERVETYLNGLKSLKAHFVQVAPNGAISEGTAWIERPGRLRFQYDPPSPFLLLASSGVLTFHDGSLHQDSNIPLGRTPLGILLSDHVTLSGAVTVTGIHREPGQLQVTVVRTADPGDGSLTLTFSEQPLALRQWTVVDAQRRETHITLYDIKTGGTYDRQLFDQVTIPAGTSLNPH